MLEDIPLHGEYDDDEDEYEVAPLPDLTHESLNLQDEILNNLNRARQLFNRVEKINSISPNQKAQVLNTISTILRQMVNSQAELHNAQTFKILEETLIETLKETGLHEVFLEKYNARLKSIGT